MTPWCFIHIPKNAGSSLRKVVGRDSYHTGKYQRHHPNGKPMAVKAHVCASWICSVIGQEAWESLDSFAVTRNPWDRMVSLYQYSRPKVKWELWLDRVLQHDRPSGNQHRLQLYYITDADGAVMVKHLLRFETLAEDFSALCLALGWPEKELPRVNATRPHHCSDWYTARTRRLVAEHFAPDIEAFHYTYG